MDALNKIINAINDPNVTLTEEELREMNLSESAIKKVMLMNQNVQKINQIMLNQNDNMVESANDTFVLIKDLKQSLKDTLSENKSSQHIAKAMYVMTFGLGLVLIAFAIYFGIQGKNILAISFGSFGMIDIIAHLVADPPVKIQDSRSNYAQLTVGMLAWFNDFVNNSGMIVTSNQQSMQIQSLDIDLNSRLNVQQDMLNNYLLLSDAQINNTIKLLRLIDDVAEPTNKVKANKDLKLQSNSNKKAEEVVA